MTHPEGQTMADELADCRHRIRILEGQIVRTTDAVELACDEINARRAPCPQDTAAWVARVDRARQDCDAHPVLTRYLEHTGRGT